MWEQIPEKHDKWSKQRRFQSTPQSMNVDWNGGEQSRMRSDGQSLRNQMNQIRSQVPVGNESDVERDFPQNVRPVQRTSTFRNVNRYMPLDAFFVEGRNSYEMNIMEELNKEQRTQYAPTYREMEQMMKVPRYIETNQWIDVGDREEDGTDPETQETTYRYTRINNYFRNVQKVGNIPNLRNFT